MNVIMQDTFEKYIDERISFMEPFIHIPEFYKASKDFIWVKSMLEKEKMGNIIFWDDIATVVTPYIYKSYFICINNYKDDLLPYNYRLEAKKIADCLLKIYNDIISKCNKPFSTLLFLTP